MAAHAKVPKWEAFQFYTNDFLSTVDRNRLLYSMEIL